jgi:hypothetical protein
MDLVTALTLRELLGVNSWKMKLRYYIEALFSLS